MRFPPLPRAFAIFILIAVPMFTAGCQSASSGRHAVSNLGTTGSIKPLKAGEPAPEPKYAAVAREPITNPEPVAAMPAPDPIAAGTYNLRGSTHGEAGRYVEALADFDRAIAAAPDYFQAYSNRALVYVRMGRMDAAMADFTRAIQLDPDYVPARIGRGKLYHHVRQNDAAMKDFTRAIDLTDDDPIIYFNRGLVFQATGRHGDAIGDFERAWSFRPGAAEPLYMKARSQMALERYRAAMTTFDRIARTDGKNAKVWTLRGIAAERLKLRHEAARDYRRALKLSPRNREARDGLARVMRSA